MHLLLDVDRVRPVQPASVSVMADCSSTVFIVDDDVSVRESLEALIQTVGWEVRAFASAEEFLHRPPSDGPCCLVLDVSLPDLNGLDLQDRMTSQQADMPIIFISGYGDVPMSVRAMKAGAVEFLTKPLNEDALLGAIAGAIERSREVVGHSAELRKLQTCFDTLSRREREVMTLVVTGLLNKQVGFELGISEITVKAHRGRVMEKMKARSFVDLIRMSSRLGLAAPGAGH
jgi:FixJ family two-component response regulator